MPRTRITTIKQLNDKMETDYTDLTLGLHKLNTGVDEPPVVDADGQLAAVARAEKIAGIAAQLGYINVLRLAMGEQRLTMYVEDGEDGPEVFQDIKRQLVPKRD